MAQVDRAEAREITSEIEAAVTAILEKHGLAKSQVKTGFGDYYKFTLEAAPLVLGLNGVNEGTKEAQAYKAFGRSYNLAEDLLGIKFTVKGSEYIFAGVAASRSKYPIVAIEVATGKDVVFTQQVVSLINQAKEAN